MGTSKHSVSKPDIDLSTRLMRGGLSALRMASNAPVVERLGLRPVLNKVIFEGARLGYGAVTQMASKSSGASAKTRDAVARPTKPSLFDLEPTDEQVMMQETVQRFAREHLLEQARVADDESALPQSVIDAWNSLGMAEMLLPEAYGGFAEERSPVSVALVLEALAAGDAGMAWGLLAPLSVAVLLLDHGTDAQCDQYLQGFVGDNPTVASLAIMERTAVFDPRTVSTRAGRVPRGWVVRGRSRVVARCKDASFLVVAARAPGGPALFIVPADQEGVALIDEPAMGLRSAEVRDLELTAVMVGDDALIGGDVSHARYNDVLDRTRTAWCAVSSGVSNTVSEYVRTYANERHAFGEPISHRQAVAFLIADMAIESAAIRMTMLRAAARLEHDVHTGRAVSTARTLATNKGMFVGTNGVQILGGHGFVKDHLMELWYRNLRGAGILEGGLYI